MKRIILFVLLFAALKVAGQTTGYLRFDTVRVMKQNGTCELYIINKTKDSLGLLTNIGGGLTSFKRSRSLNDSTIIVGLDTLTIHGTGGSTITLTNASGAGDTLVTSSNTVKRIDHDATLIASTNGNKILLGVDTISYIASQHDLTQITNIATGSQTANGNYTHNWANNNLTFNSIKGLFFNTTGSLSGKTKSGRIYSDPGDFDDIPFMIMLKTSKNGQPSQDSLRNFIRETSGQLEIRATNFITNKQSGFVLSQNGIGITAFGTGLTNSKGISIDTTGIYLSGAEPAASADSIAAWGAYDPINGTNKLLKIPTPSGGTISEPDQQIIFGTGPGVTSEAPFVYNPSTNKLTVDSTRTKRLKTDSAAFLGARSVVGQDDPSYPWQRSDQWYSDGAYPGIFTVVNTDSVNCVACTPGQSVSVSDSTNGRGLVIATYSESTGGNFIRTMKARGNWKAPSAIKSGDVLSGWGAWGYGATKFSGSAVGFHLVATEDFTDAAWGTEIQFFTTPNGTQDRTYNLKLLNDGSSLFGGTINAPNINVVGAGSRFLTVNSTDDGAVFTRFQRNGSTKAVFGTAAISDQYVTGSVANDFVIRAGESGGSGAANMIFSVDGATIAGAFNTSGQFQLNDVAGSGDRVAKWSGTGIAGTISNGSDGDVLTMVSGVPAFAAPAGGSPSLQSVTTTGNTTSNSIIFQAAGSNDDAEMKAAQLSDDIATVTVRASQGTNTGTIFRLIPRGDGFSSTFKGAFDLFNTDQVADGSNIELLRFAATGTTGYVFNSLKGGTGTVRPFKIQFSSTDAVTFNTDATVTFAGDVTVPDDAYDATGWNGNNEVPTKNAIRDKIESLTSSSGDLIIVNDADYTVLSTDKAIRYHNAITAFRTLTFPSAASFPGREIIVKLNTVNSSQQLTITSASNIFLNGTSSSTSQPINVSFSSWTFKSDGTSWYQIN